ncbi:hypothetical protein ACFQ12_26415, partial [Methylobacterium trifolii]
GARAERFAGRDRTCGAGRRRTTGLRAIAESSRPDLPDKSLTVLSYFADPTSGTGVFSVSRRVLRRGKNATFAQR